MPPTLGAPPRKFAVDEFALGNPENKVDPAVLNALPEGSTVLSTVLLSTNPWWQTGRIDVLLPDNNTRQSYLINVVPKGGDKAYYMMRSQHESAAAINAVVPGFVPRPVAWGTYESTEDLDDTQFHLSEFVALANDVINTTEDGKGLAKPDPVDFAAKVARLHTQSSAVLDEAAKEGFGFEYETYPGPLANFTGRRDGWEAFFSWHLRRALREERLARDGEHDEDGTDEQLDDLGPYLFGAVIPRLLKPLESKGRTVTPALVHGDLWAGSVAREEKTGESVVLDAACLWAHNEYELAQWRLEGSGLGQEYLDEYHKLVPKSEPVEDYDARLDLYKVKFDAHLSALFPENKDLREQLVKGIKSLVDRFGDWTGEDD